MFRLYYEYGGTWIVDKCPICKQIDWRSKTFKNTIICQRRLNYLKKRNCRN